MRILDSEMLVALLNRSLAGAALILITGLVCLLLGRLPKRYRSVLWLIPFLRLLLPVSIPVPVSLLPVNPQPILEAEVSTGRLPIVDTGVPVIDVPVNYALMSTMMPDPMASADPAQIYLFLFGWVWAAGAVCFIGVNLLRYFCMKRRMLDAVPGEDGAYYSDRISMPMVMGIVTPQIYLPAFLAREENREEKNCVLAHEKAHIRRFDHLAKLAAFAALAVHWFNPLVWAAFFFYCRDVEMACDESVVERLGMGKRRSYSEALLHFEERRSALFIPLAFGESHTKARIKNILRYQTPAFWRRFLAAVLVTAAAFILLSSQSQAAFVSVGIIGGADGPTSIFLAGKLSGDTRKETAKQLDVEAACERPYGAAVELDYVSAGRISLHGSFGYLAFSFATGANGENKAALVSAVTLSEAGPIQMQGDGYTEILGGEGVAMIVPDAYTPDTPKRMYCYLEGPNTIEELDTGTADDLAADRAFGDARIEEELVPELSELVRREYGSQLLYGPVVVPQFDSNVYGFLAADGELLKEVWYGLWWDGYERIVRIDLFDGSGL